MSDLHRLPLVEHDMPHRPVVRASVHRVPAGWFWMFEGTALLHGPFGTWREAYDSARRMVEEL